MIDRIIRASASRPALAIILALAGTIFGTMSLQNLRRDVFPDLSAPVCNVGDVPVHGEAHCHANHDAPHDPRPTSEPEQDDGDRNLVQHPCALKEPIEWVVANAFAGIKVRRIVEQQPEVEIVKAIQ